MLKIKIIWDVIMCLQLPKFRKQRDASKSRELFANGYERNIPKDLHPPLSLFYSALSFQLHPYGCKLTYVHTHARARICSAYPGEGLVFHHILFRINPG